MIKIVLFLCRFAFVNAFMQRLVITYQAKQVDKTRMLTLDEKCQLELEKIKKNKKESKVYFQHI